MSRNIYNNPLKSADVAVSVTGPFLGAVIGTQSNTQIAPSVITNTNISNTAAISDTKLNTISTSNKVANSATTATSSNTTNAIVARDTNGAFIATAMYGDIDSSGIGALNVGTTNASTVNIGTATTTQIVNVGTGSGITTINLGGAGDTVNVAGTLAYINTTNLNVTDSNITLNKGGSGGSGAGSGISIEEGGITTGYVQQNGTRASWNLKSSSTAGVVSITPGTSNFTINQGSHNPVTFNTPGNGFYIDANTN